MNIAEPPPTPVRSAPLWPLSVAAYHALGEMGLIPQKTELLYGFVYKKMPKSPLHAALLRRLLELLGMADTKGYFISQDQPITCVDSEPEPDISIVRGASADYWERHPTTAELVVEICVTSYEYDRSKLKAYAQAGVKECWLVLASEKRIEIHQNPIEGVYTIERSLGPDGEIASASIPGVTLSIPDIFTPG